MRGNNKYRTSLNPISLLHKKSRDEGELDLRVCHFAFSTKCCSSVSPDSLLRQARSFGNVSLFFAKFDCVMFGLSDSEISYPAAGSKGTHAHACADAHAHTCSMTIMLQDIVGSSPKPREKRIRYRHHGSFSLQTIFTQHLVRCIDSLV